MNNFINNTTQSIKKKHIIIFTDGACRGNPGPGGWGALLRYKEIEKTINGAIDNTTNNRMELTAVIQALLSLKESCTIDLTTDSMYVKDGITKWLPQWQKRNWRTADKKPVKNLDLWQKLSELTKKHDIKWHWVKGHSGQRENEIVDNLANLALDKFLQQKQKA